MVSKGPNEVAIRKILTNDVKFAIGLITVVTTIGIPYFNITKDIALIQQSINTIQLNHEKHIEDILVQMNAQNTKIQQHSEALVMLMVRVSRINNVPTLNQ